MSATSLSSGKQLLVVLSLLFATLNCNYAYALSDHSGVQAEDVITIGGGPVLTNWFRRMSSSKTEGSWLWGWAWGADNTVSVVDRSPPVSFVSRPASFGRMIEDALNGYGIPMNAFTHLCRDGKDEDNGTDTSRGKGKGNDGRDRHGNLMWASGTRNETGPNLGCPRLCPNGNHLPEPEDAWIAIVQRGKCSFVSKVREAQRFGAKAVIVGGDDPATSGNPDVLVNMYSQTDSSDIKIPSTYIKFSDYTRLANLIATSNTSTSGIKTVSLQITADYASWEWYSPILTFIVLLLLPSALTLTTLLIHRIRATRAEQRERAPEAVVNRLPWRVWTGSGWEKHEGPVPPLSSTKFTSDTDLERGESGAELDLDSRSAGVGEGLVPGQCKPSTSQDDDGDGDGDAAETQSVNPPWFDAQTECAICLNDFERGDRVRVLPCKHIFHLDEVDEWLIHRKKLCPVCKADVTQPSHLYVHHEYDHPRPDDHDIQTTPAVQPNERTPLLAVDRRSIVDDTYTRPHSAPSVAPSTSTSRPRSPSSSRSVSCLFPRSSEPSISQTSALTSGSRRDTISTLDDTTRSS